MINNVKELENKIHENKDVFEFLFICIHCSNEFDKHLTQMFRSIVYYCVVEIILENVLKQQQREIIAVIRDSMFVPKEQKDVLEYGYLIDNNIHPLARNMFVLGTIPEVRDNFMREPAAFRFYFNFPSNIDELVSSAKRSFNKFFKSRGVQ